MRLFVSAGVIAVYEWWGCLFFCFFNNIIYVLSDCDIMQHII